MSGEQHADSDAPRSTEAPAYERFGPVDEIDTTPHEEPQKLMEIQPVLIAHPEAIPNAASTPVWSLEAERAKAPPKPRVEMVPEPKAAERTPEAPAPVKKGWWQRAFRTD